MNRTWLIHPQRVAVLLLALSAGAASAHHSYAPFDATREIALTGTVRTWEMGNPHGYLWLNVTDKKTGKKDIWGMEAPSPVVLVRRGWSKYSVKVGDEVTVTINPLRDGRHGGNIRSIKFSDGRLIEIRPMTDKPPMVPRTVNPPATGKGP